jgi:hypothetical protein
VPARRERPRQRDRRKRVTGIAECGDQDPQPARRGHVRRRPHGILRVVLRACNIAFAPTPDLHAHI